MEFDGSSMLNKIQKHIMIMNTWNPQDYHKNSSEQTKWGLELLEKIDFTGNERVIDLGCGDGKITAEIASRMPLGSILGIDKSEEMIRFAREHFSQDVFPNLAFSVHDIRDLSFHEEFDIAFSNAALHWVPDHAHALQTIAAGLKRGGRIIAQMGGKGNAEGILNILRQVIETKKWAVHFNNFSPPYTFYDNHEYRLLIESVGLIVKRIEVIPKFMSYRREEDLEAWIRTTWLPYTGRVPEPLQPEFIREIVDAYRATRHLDNNGTIQVEMVRLEFEAVKKQ